MPPSRGTNGWDEWSKHVLLELERLNACYDGLRADFTELKISFERAQATDLASSRTRNSVWGLLGGIVTVVVYVIAESLLT